MIKMMESYLLYRLSMADAHWFVGTFSTLPRFLAFLRCAKGEVVSLSIPTNPDVKREGPR